MPSVYYTFSYILTLMKNEQKTNTYSISDIYPSNSGNAI